MPTKHLAVLCIATSLLIWGCGRKQVPQQSADVSATKISTTATTATAAKPAVKKVPAPAIPKVIVVNDNIATKSFDGRLYYDLNSRRYWRNYNDGKYYLFNKSMYADSAFKPH
jgi:ABC-type enterochelin transport system substrate-binding protein